ncbi:MAG: hypothetical protein ABI615_10755 [Chthoniobacterales bacterium]
MTQEITVGLLFVIFAVVYAWVTIHVLANVRTRTFSLLLIVPLPLAAGLWYALRYYCAHCTNLGVERFYTGLLILEIIGLFFVSYAATMIFMLVKKRWRIFVLMLLLPLLLAGVAAGAGQMHFTKERAADYTGFFDVPLTTLGKPLFLYDSERGFQGDGYSFAVYELPEAIRKRFTAPDAKLLDEFPHIPGYRNNGWGRMAWQEGPINPKMTWYTDFAFNTTSEDMAKAPELEKQFAAIRTALTRKNIFYAFFYKAYSHMSNIDFFLIDLDENKLYIINNNT